jgi:hypothetical protein
VWGKSPAKAFAVRIERKRKARHGGVLSVSEKPPFNRKK